MGKTQKAFVPSCAELEPFEGEQVVFCGFLSGTLSCPELLPDARRNAIVIYMGTGSVKQAAIRHVASALARNTNYEIYAAGVDGDPINQANLHIAERFDFSELLPRARVFVNHGGQNSVMDALANCVPQLIYPGQVFERRYNAQSIEHAGAGMQLGRFEESVISRAIEEIVQDDFIAVRVAELRNTMCSLGGTSTIVDEANRLLVDRQ